MTKKEFFDLAERYHLGTCTKEEKDTFEILYDRFQENSVSEQELPKDEMDRIRVSVLHKIHEQIKDVPQPHRINWYQAMRIAASVMLFLIAGLSVLYVTNKQKEQATAMIEYKSINELIPYTLPDGSKVWLKEQSHLWIPAKFNKDVRQVVLQGQAYFSVAKDKARPFRVKTGEIYTEVLGTEFNIKADPDDEQISVSLVEGKVKVIESPQSQKLLLPSQQLVYSRTSRSSMIGLFDATEVTGWKDNILVMKNEPLATAILKIGKKYKKQIILVNEGLKNCKVNANLKDETFESVLEMLHFSLNIEYKVVDKTIQLSGKGC